MEQIILNESVFVIKSKTTIYEKVEAPIKIESPSLKRAIVPWGEDNDFPNQTVALVGKNPTGNSSIEFKIDVTYGSGVKVGYIQDEIFKEFSKEELEKRTDLKQITDFFEYNDIQAQYAELISDLHWFHHGYVELILDKERKNIVLFSSKEATYSRLEQANPKTGQLEHHVYFANWPENPKSEDIDVTKLLSYKAPSRDLEIRMGLAESIDGITKTETDNRYIIPVRLTTPGKLYYPKPYYLSAIESGWIDFANAIPQFKKAYMKNTMSIKYIIEIDKEYFPRIFAEEGIETKEEQAERKRKELTNINTFLKGAEAAGKSMITYSKRTPNGEKSIPEIQITVLNAKIGGEFLEDSQEAAANIFNAFRVHPSMIGVIPGKTSSNLSGSDKRELLRIAQSMQGRIRHTILKPLYVVKKINKWPEDVVFAISDIILTTLDTNGETQKITTV